MLGEVMPYHSLLQFLLVLDRLDCMLSSWLFAVYMDQGRTQEGADGAKASPLNPRKKVFIHSNPEHFMFRSLYKEVSFTIIL